jgi:hypothetical protein
MKRDWLTLAFGVALVGVVLALSLRHNMREPEPAPAPTASAPTAAPPAAATPATPPAEAPSAAPSTANARPRAPRTPSATPSPEPSGAAAATGVILQVQSDVAGASVFLDREYVGTTPLTLQNLTTGTKRINVTAEGHDGYVDTIDLTEGTNKVNVEFRRVRLNASVPVVHKHGMGSCQGTLAASVRGLTYDTANKGDAFVLTFDEIDQFDVDYMKKNLRIRRRGGKTWNFTNESADALFVFHRDVAKAREKLASAR